MNFLIKSTIIFCVIFQRCLNANSANTDNNLPPQSEKEIVDSLVNQWAPLVWLAPNEKYLPGSVTNFLKHVHAEEAKVSTSQINDIADINNLHKYSYFYEDENELTYYDPNGYINNRNKRNFKDPSTSLDYLFDLPIGDESKNWFLVTNNDIEELIVDKTSFIYGENPAQNNVPIYAVISMCKSPAASSFSYSSPLETSSSTDSPYSNLGSEVSYNTIERIEYKKNPYIPLSKNIFDLQSDTNVNLNMVEKSIRLIRKRRSENETSTESEAEEFEGRDDDEDDDGDWETITERRDDIIKVQTNEIEGDYPHFHVTYWMFYPYSHGKVICTLNLGPLGPIPIPLIFGMCLGTKKEFGSHIGDWEHMSLFFRGKKEPDEMYVSAHDSGAYYSYEKLTGTFEYRSQETRKGILQRPSFPKTVITSKNHPVLFAAEGSHGLWTAPGKHRFVRVPRLYDVNGFGTPWSTWRNVEIIYENDSRGRRSLNPKWLKFRGRWGNPKTKCHPLKKIGLHFCQYSDGPTGIPRKKPHFFCKRK